MALSGTINGTTTNQYITAKLEWSATQSIANNTSTVTAVLYYRKSSASSGTTAGVGMASITIDGTTTSNNSYSYSLTPNNTWVKVLTASKTITHNADGTKSISMSAQGKITAVSSTFTGTTLSGTATLDTIPRASSPSCASSVNFGSAITVNTNRKSSSFTHTLVFKVGSYSQTVTGVGASTNFTVPASWAASIPSGTSTTMSITCTTYNGSTQIGSATSTSTTVNVPSSWVPTIGSLTASLVDGFNNMYVKTKSKVKLTASSVSASTGSSISSYAFSGNNISASGTSATATSNVLTVAGSNTYTLKVTDARGRTASKTVAITVTDYYSPTVKISARRCDEDGTANDFGEYFIATMTTDWSNISGNNYSVTFRYKKTSASSYTTGNTWTSQTMRPGSFTTSITAADVNSAYNLQATITDAVGKSYTVTMGLSNGFVPLDVLKGGKMLSIGGTASREPFASVAPETSYESLFFENMKAAFLNGNIFVPKNGGTDGFSSGWISLNNSLVQDYSVAKGWVKLSNGHMFEWGNHNVSGVQVANAYGSLYQGLVSITYSEPFYEAPIAWIGKAQIGTGASWGVVYSTSADTLFVRVFDIVKRTSTTDVCNIFHFSWGRWK